LDFVIAIACLFRHHERLFVFVILSACLFCHHERLFVFVILSAAAARVFDPPILRVGGRGVEWTCCSSPPCAVA
jgi:hypothetical protein